MTILLIDDDEDDRKLFFEVTGEVDKTATCITTGNGQEGLAYLRDEKNELQFWVVFTMSRLEARVCEGILDTNSIRSRQPGLPPKGYVSRTSCLVGSRKRTRR